MGNTLDWKKMKEKVDKTADYINPFGKVTTFKVKPAGVKAPEDKSSFKEEPTTEPTTAPTAKPTTEPTTDPTGVNAPEDSGASKKELTHEDAYALQQQYLEEYLGRGEFDYDINTDEMYKLYRQQALDTAEKLRRDTTAQAAGLTGGYGSTYAAAVGSDAAADYMHDFDAEIAPELYEAAYSRYKNEGADLLEKSDIAGSLGDSLYQGSDEYNAILAALGEATGEETGESEGGLTDAERETILRRTYDNGYNSTWSGWFDAGDKPIMEEIEKRVVDKGYSHDELYNYFIEYGGWEDGLGKEAMTKEEIAVIVAEGIKVRATKWQNSDGHSPLEYARNLYNSGAGNEAIIDKLYEYKSKDGKSLSDEDIAFIINNI